MIRILELLQDFPLRHGDEFPGSFDALPPARSLSLRVGRPHPLDA